jgi:hypothetical protein
MNQHLLFIDNAGTLHLSLEARRVDAPGDPTDEKTCAAELDRWLAESPDVARQELAIYSLRVHHGDLDPIVDVLAARRPASSLVRIGASSFPDFDRGNYIPEDLDRDGSSWHLAFSDLCRLLHALPATRELTVQVSDLHAGVAADVPLAAPELRSLVLRCPGPNPSVFAALGRATFPKLESLELWFPGYHYGWGGTASDLAPLLANPDLPALRHLAIIADVGTPWLDVGGEPLIDVLAASPLLPRLSVLVLSHGTITDAGATRLRDAWPAFAHLARLDLTANAISPALETALLALGGRAIRSDWQRSSHAEILRCEPPMISLFDGLLGA